MAYMTETTETRHHSVDAGLKLVKSYNHDFNKMFEDQYVLAFR